MAFSSLYEQEGSQVDEMEDGVSLCQLVDHEEDAAFIAQSIQQWLDDEWIPQDVHKMIGEKCAQLYMEVSGGGLHGTRLLVGRRAHDGHMTLTLPYSPRIEVTDAA